ncbi:hypothetical protein [Nonomuraea sp. LPB2021202275-12-8]|uniref:hypothetical protein n=1 Tax=Nonomuraea sp. LPB2021202275-12-8 TaxID=3120159 RepID=UPI00300CE98D
MPVEREDVRVDDGAGERRDAGPAPVARAALFVRRHGWFVGLLAVGAALRVVAALGYRPALWFPDTYTYIVTVFKPRPDLVRPAGYSMFVKLLEPFHAFGVVAAVQHLLGLATGVLVYWAVLRRVRRGWAATLAAAPVLLDAYQIQLEHLLVSDTLFMFLVVLAVVLSLADRPSAVTIGLLLAAATLTRTVGQPLILLLVAWFLLRRQVRPAAVLLAAALVPVIAYGAWFYGTYQRVGIIGANGVFLYARTMSFADCARMDPPPDLRVLCDARPPEQRPPSQEYIWAKDAPLVALPGITFTEQTDDLAGRFATLAIRTQPLDYAASVLSELGRSFVWGRPVYPDQEIYDYYQFPTTSPGPPGRYAAQLGVDYSRHYERGPIGTAVVEPYAGWMRAYQDVARLPGAVLLAVLLVPPALAAGRRLHDRRAGAPPGRWREAGPAPWLLPWSTAIVLLVTPAAAAEFDYRYVLPAVPLAFLAAALACGNRKDFLNDIPRNVRL